MKLSDIDLSKLRFPMLKKLIQKQMHLGMVHFTDLKSTEPNSEQMRQYGFMEDEYLLDYPIQKVFNHYQKADPSDAWNGSSLVDFGLALDKTSGRIFYPGESYPGATVGQVVYLHLNILGLKKICVSHEIVKVDHENYNITLSYIEKGMTKGIQIIQFNETQTNKTKITHTTHYQGVSRFRDKYLYSFFHRMITNRFHKNLKASLN